MQHWLESSALGVFVALLGVWVAWVTLRWQKRHAKQLAAEQQSRQEERAAAERQAREEERQAREAQAAREEERAAAEAQAAWEQRCRSLLALWPLPKVEDADPYAIGVFYSRRAEGYRGARQRPPYVPRALDEELAGLFGAQRLILVKGQSRAGKSRTAFEVAARELAGWRLLIPKDRAALAALADLDPLPGQGEKVLVWLDDLDEYLAVEGGHGLDAGLLDRWAGCEPPVVVLATIRLEEYIRLTETRGQVSRHVQRLLNRFAPGALTLPVTFRHPSEQAAIAELYPNEQMVGGLAEHLAAVHELVDRLEVGQATVPEGAGLVLAAVDCRRAGLTRPIAKADLAALLPLYLRRLRPLKPFQDADVETGLDWATHEVGRTAALLLADPDLLSGTFRVADPIVDFVERRPDHQPVESGVWEYLLDVVSPEDAIGVAFAADTRGEAAVEKAAWRKIADSGNREAAPTAALALGVLLQREGDLTGARTAFKQASDSDHREAAPIAALNLGIQLADQRDTAGARAAYQQAINSGHREAAPMAARYLGLLLLKKKEDVASAKAAFQQAIDSGHPDEAPKAARNLATLLTDHDDLTGAKAAYQQAINSGHPEEAPAAAYNLGGQLTKQKDVAGARTAYQQAVNFGHPDIAPKAAFNLGLLLVEHKDLAGAKAAFRQAVNSGHKEAAPKAAFNLALLLAKHDDLAGAKAAYQQAINSGHPDLAPEAARNLGLLLADHDDLVGANAAYQQAINSGHKEAAPKAAFNLATLLADHDDLVGAKAAYQQAINSGHKEAAPIAALSLAMLLQDQGDPAGAKAAYQQAVASGHQEVAAAAQQALQDLSESGHR
jgi:Tfp pilus assembly protein PilF